MLIFLLCLFIQALAMGQGLVKHKADTVLLSRFEFVQNTTNNGSDCICSITNTSKANVALIVMTGAPRNTMLSDSSATFNGVHFLKPGQQIVAVGNFEGQLITVLNLSLLGVTTIIMIKCPN